MLTSRRVSEAWKEKGESKAGGFTVASEGEPPLSLSLLDERRIEGAFVGSPLSLPIPRAIGRRFLSTR